MQEDKEIFICSTSAAIFAKRVFLKATSVAAVEKLIKSDRKYAATVDQ